MPLRQILQISSVEEYWHLFEAFILFMIFIEILLQNANLISILNMVIPYVVNTFEIKSNLPLRRP